MPQSPKAPGDRIRRNHGQKEWAVVGPRKGKAPALRADLRKNAAAVAYWKTVWSSPFAGAYLEADIMGLELGAEIIVSLQENFQASLIAQLNAIFDRYGLSPRARQNLMWMVAESDPMEEAKAEEAARAKEGAAIMDMRGRLVAPQPVP